VGAGVWFVGIGLTLSDVGEAVGVCLTACCSDVGAEFWFIGAALSGALSCAACVRVEACDVADIGAAVRAVAGAGPAVGWLDTVVAPRLVGVEPMGAPASAFAWEAFDVFCG
jgi:hypothetical protein